MNILSLLISVVFTLHWFFSSVDAYQCQHDSDELTRNLPPEYFESIKDMGLKRNLGESNPKPLRVTFDFSYLDDDSQGIKTQHKEYIKKLMFASKHFLENFIKVIPRQTPIIRRHFDTCIDAFVQPSLKTTGVSNSDLHILVTYEKKREKYIVLAKADACEYDPGPIIGRVKFNIAAMDDIEKSPEGFELDFSAVFHVITHLLGFSKGAMQYWIDPETGKPYLTNVGKIQIKENVRHVGDTIKLKSKNVLETARRYFNCPTLQSFALENQGGYRYIGSHWEKDLLQNEYMTASDNIDRAVVSQFTAALLMDTGFYAEINLNMVEKMYWGEGKGCDFVEKDCSAETKFPEFSHNKKEVRCDFHNVGYGGQSTSKFSQCNYIESYTNTKCYDTILNEPNKIKRNNPGPGSKCFQSTAIDEDYQSFRDYGSRCHKFTCSEDKKVIDVEIWKGAGIDINAKCTSPNQVIDLTNKAQKNKGSLTCPSDFEKFCSFPKYCNNFCNGNGICQKGICHCLEGFVSEDCSKTCPIPEVWDGTNCILKCKHGYFLNPDNTCKTVCPSAYYRNSTTNKCDICDKSCSFCTGPSNNECFKCNEPYKLYKTSCVDPSNVTLTCDSSCLTCTGPDNNQCSSCSDGKFLDENKRCVPCFLIRFMKLQKQDCY